MGEAGIAHRLIDLLGNAASFPGDKSDRDLARLIGQCSSDAGIDVGSQRVDLGPSRQIPRRRRRPIERRDFASGVAGGAEAGEPGLARESKPPGSTGSGSG